ncbi:MAG: IS66 family insertion sequence element accessory protein TnpB [Planctomycetota bacterium]
MAREAVDLRKAFDGLCAITRDVFVQARSIHGPRFVFFNRRRDRIKLLLWERNGFWLLYERLERGTFEVLTKAASSEEAHIEIDGRRLRLLLDGVDTKSSRFRRHFACDVRIADRSRRDGSDDQPATRSATC